MCAALCLVSAHASWKEDDHNDRIFFFLDSSRDQPQVVGKAAIKAALNPAKTKALYFVAKGDGTHAFSETLLEHNRAVAKYQKCHRVPDYKFRPITSKEIQNGR